MDVSEVTAQLTRVTTDYSTCDHRVIRRRGFHRTVKRGPIQILRCYFCGQKFLEGTETRTAKRLRVITALAKPGATIKGVARAQKVTCVLVRKYFRIMRARALAQPQPCAILCTMKQQSKPEAQHRVAVFLDPPLYKMVKDAAKSQGTAITQLLAHLAASRFKYKPQIRQFKDAA